MDATRVHYVDAFSNPVQGQPLAEMINELLKKLEPEGWECLEIKVLNQGTAFVIVGRNRVSGN